MRRRIIVTTALLLLALIVGACQQNSNDSEPIVIETAWVRPGSEGENSAVYFHIKNNQETDDSAIGAESDAAMMTQLHMSRMTEDGTMMMEHQETVPLPAGSEVNFEPGGLHIMLMNLSRDLNTGDTISVTIAFENAEPITFQAAVGEP